MINNKTNQKTVKIFICVSQLKEIGGITPSILNLLNEIGSLHDVTLCILGYRSTVKEVPSNIHIVKGSSWLYDCKTPRYKLKYRNLNEKIRGVCRRLLRKLFGLEYVLGKVAAEIKKNNNHVVYDVAIAYTNNLYNSGVLTYGGDYDVVLKSVESKKKLAWIHNDPIRCGFSHDICLEVFKNFDAIVCVSKDNKRLLDELCPEYSYKSLVVYNMYDIQRIKRMSREGENPFCNKKSFHFVTVARIDNHQKRIDRIVSVCERLITEGYNDFDWTIVGDGGDRAMIQKAINEKGLQNLFLVGLKTNPYPYMLYADATLLVSEYEGYGMTVKEAQVLGTPTIITNYDCAYEVMTDGCEGIICENSTQGVYDAVKTLLDNPKKLGFYKKYLKEHPVNNELSLRQFNEAVNL